MPAIKPISDLRNYTEVLKEVDTAGRVYLTRNGHGAYAIMSIEEADELDRIKAANTLVTKLREAKARADREGWVEDEEIQKTMIDSVQDRTSIVESLCGILPQTMTLEEAKAERLNEKLRHK